MPSKRDCQDATTGANKKKTPLKDTTEIHQNRGAFHAHGVLTFDEAVDHVADVPSEANQSNALLIPHDLLDLHVTLPMVAPVAPNSGGVRAIASEHPVGHRAGVDRAATPIETAAGQDGHPDLMNHPMQPQCGTPVTPDAKGVRADAPGSPIGVRMDAVPAVSPGGNRDRFMANSQPLKVSCDLSTVGLHNASMRFTFQAVALIVYPESIKPERRHLQLIDSRGSTGLTVWGPHVKLFSPSSVGQVVKFTRLSLVVQNGRKGLSMSRDSTVTFVSDAAGACEESKWWASLLQVPPLRIIDVHDVEDDLIVSVKGIVGTISTEIKKVKLEDKELLCMRLTDRTGFIDIRSWCHSEAEFERFRERPVCFKRVRVTSFSGMKILELLDASGTILADEFDGAADLRQYWRE
jgi:hypothetical protein